MKKALIVIGIILVVALIGLAIFFTATPSGRTIINNWKYSLEKADEVQYEKQKQVEDTCRAMITSYKTDKLTYEQYINSDVAEERGWANSAKLRANQTANTYNEYILKNSFVWKDNVPEDIYLTLEVIN